MNYDFTQEDDNLMQLCLTLFISSEVDFCPTIKKAKKNIYAITALQKLKRREPMYTLEEIHVLYTSLYFLFLFLGDPKNRNTPNRDLAKLFTNAKRNRIVVQNLISVWRETLLKCGVDIDAF